MASVTIFNQGKENEGIIFNTRRESVEFSSTDEDGDIEITSIAKKKYGAVWVTENMRSISITKKQAQILIEHLQKQISK